MLKKKKKGKRNFTTHLLETADSPSSSIIWRGPGKERGGGAVPPYFLKGKGDIELASKGHIRREKKKSCAPAGAGGKRT